MLTPFPGLLTWGLLSPLIIRITLGVILTYWGYKALRDTSGTTNKKVTGIVDVVVGLMCIVGFYTQIAAMIAALGLIIRIIERIKNKAFLTDGINYYLIVLVLALSLIVTGAGLFAFDIGL
jgi:uncharacterized membrane protein YphA (DoxX/SURF4 family)